MSASLVGSEMCIRDSVRADALVAVAAGHALGVLGEAHGVVGAVGGRGLLLAGCGIGVGEASIDVAA
eukprot:4232208-Alexandrium_andersonii.AAC.1